jgi:2-polyprenyl-3-methyl-5-hydroxy-6-metoxy-1,4-benzoquinol methylase
MENKKIIPPELYTKEYYLSDNDEHREFTLGLDANIHDKFKRVLKLITINKDSTILDIGCGRGELVYYCVKNGAIGYGIDYSQDAVDIANQIKSGLPGHLQQRMFFEKNTAEGYTYDKKYDYIFMIETAEHMYDWQLKESLEKISKSLKPTGTLIITTPNHLYESFLQPVKMFLDTPFRFLKMLFRIPRGKYRPKSVKEFFKRLLRFKPDRGETCRKMHGNVMTPGRLRKLLKNFNARVYCEDPSLHPLSLLLRKWQGRQIVAVAKLK